MSCHLRRWSRPYTKYNMNSPCSNSSYKVIIMYKIGAFHGGEYSYVGNKNDSLSVHRTFIYAVTCVNGQMWNYCGHCPVYFTHCDWASVSVCLRLHFHSWIPYLFPYFVGCIWPEQKVIKRHSKWVLKWFWILPFCPPWWFVVDENSLS